jgi:pilus assembly protein Flp/PilA
VRKISLEAAARDRRQARLTPTTVCELRAIGGRRRRRVARALRFHRLSRGRNGSTRPNFALATVRVSLRAGGMDMEFIARINKFVNAEDGQDLLEYALLVALIALVAIVGVTAAGLKVNTIFSNVATALPAGS